MTRETPKKKLRRTLSQFIPDDIDNWFVSDVAHIDLATFHVDRTLEAARIRGEVIPVYKAEKNRALLHARRAAKRLEIIIEDIKKLKVKER